MKRIAPHVYLLKYRGFDIHYYLSSGHCKIFNADGKLVGKATSLEKATLKVLKKEE